MDLNSHTFAVPGATLSAPFSPLCSAAVSRTGRHWILYIKSLVKLSLILALLNAGVFLFPSDNSFAIARLLLIAALLVSGFSLFATWLDAHCTRYVISSSSIQIKHGLTKISITAFLSSNIESVEVFQTIAGRFFDYGTVQIKGNSGSCKTLQYVAKPNLFRQASDNLGEPCIY